MEEKGQNADKYTRKQGYQRSTPLKQFLFLSLCKAGLKLHWENKGGKLLYSNVENYSNLNLFNIC